MDQLQNQINQVLLMLQNNPKEFTAATLPYMSGPDQVFFDEVVPRVTTAEFVGLMGLEGCYRVVAQLLAQILRNKSKQEKGRKELYRKQVMREGASKQRAYLASLKADQADQRANVAYQNTESIYGALGQFFMHYNSPNSARPFTPPAFSLVPPPPPGPSMPQLTPNWAHLLQPPFPYNQPLQPLQPPYPGPFPPLPVTNNTFNNCYQPVLNSTLASTSNTQAQRPHYTLLTNPHMNDSRSCDQLAQDLAREKNNECSSGEEEEEEGEQQSGDDYSSEEEE
ncbi:hypothetical protein Tco_0373492 [Tanacetum coccineum]